MKFGLVEQLKFEIKSLKEFYPQFVTSNAVKEIKDEIPVFVFHTVKPAEFENQLKYISENGYTTLSVNEYYKSINEGKIKSNSILLTFDDGRSSFWRVAFPLLKKYNLKATVFVIPGITGNRKHFYNLDDVWENKISMKEFMEKDKDDKEYCSWEELKIMFDFGLIDIESHTLLHKVVFTGEKITGFTDKFTHDSVLTAYRKPEEIGGEFNRDKYFGLPVFEHEPLLKGNINYKPNEDVINFCKNFYNENNNHLDWQKKLLEKIDYKKFPPFEKKTQKEVENEIENDFKLSSEIIKDKINKNAGSHLCLPWTVGSDIAISLAKKTNYKSVFWGATKKKTNKAGDDLLNNCRIKNDFIYRLPGRKRKSILSIYSSKITRRIKDEPVY